MTPQREDLTVEAPSNGNRRSAMVRVISDGGEITERSDEKLDSSAILAAVNGVQAPLDELVQMVAEATKATEADWTVSADEHITSSGIRRTFNIRCRKDKP